MVQRQLNELFTKRDMVKGQNGILEKKGLCG